MLKLNRHFENRVSNRLALVGALMLTISLLIGFGDRMDSGLNLAPATTAQASTASVADQPVNTSKVKKNRKFKASLFLLRLK
jgi:hypothetical protein